MSESWKIATRFWSQPGKISMSRASWLSSNHNMLLHYVHCCKSIETGINFSHTYHVTISVWSILFALLCILNFVCKQRHRYDFVFCSQQEDKLSEKLRILFWFMNFHKTHGSHTVQHMPKIEQHFSRLIAHIDNRSVLEPLNSHVLQ